MTPAESPAVVLDASAAVELLLSTPIGRKVAQRVADPDLALHAPHLLSVEVAQVLRRLVLRKELVPARARTALEQLAALGIERHDHELLLPRAWRLRENVTMYDALYIVLAEALDAPLLTLDGRLATAPGHRAHVELMT